MDDRYGRCRRHFQGEAPHPERGFWQFDAQDEGSVGFVDSSKAGNYVDLPDIDFRDIHSRTISIAGGDTVMTFDGNNEISFDVNLGGVEYGDWSGGEINVYLSVCRETIYPDCIRFANKFADDREVFIGRYVYDKEKRTTRLNPISKSAKKQIAPFVQRNRNNIIIRDGEKRYRANGVVPSF